jgi:hypothetical protein
MLRRELDAFVRIEDALAVDLDAAGIGMLEACDATQERRLAAAARAEQNDELSRRNRKTDVVDRGNLLAAEAAEILLEVPDLDRYVRAAFTCDAGILVENPALAGARIAAPTAA